MSLLHRFLGGPRDRFAAEALRMIGRLPGVVGARYDSEQFAIAVQRQGHAKPAWLFLSNLYGECQGASMVDTGDGYLTSLLLAAGWVAGMAARLG